MTPIVIGSFMYEASGDHINGFRFKLSHKEYHEVPTFELTANSLPFLRFALERMEALVAKGEEERLVHQRYMERQSSL